jgi:hypothetical protein
MAQNECSMYVYFLFQITTHSLPIRKFLIKNKYKKYCIVFLLVHPPYHHHHPMIGFSLSLILYIIHFFEGCSEIFFSQQRSSFFPPDIMDGVEIKNSEGPPENGTPDNNPENK